MGVTPNSWPRRRMVTASRPSASARSSARSTIASRLSSDFVITVDKLYAVQALLYNVNVRRIGDEPMNPTRRVWTLIAVSLATFMTYLDNNIVNVAIPAIQRDLHLSTAGLEWVASGYILTFASLLLAGGRLGDLFGRRRLFLLGLGIFTGSSLVAGLAGSVDVLVASRAVQGLGAALVTPTTLALISATYPEPRERTKAVGIWS